MLAFSTTSAPDTASTVGRLPCRTPTHRRSHSTIRRPSLATWYATSVGFRLPWICLANDSTCVNTRSSPDDWREFEKAWYCEAYPAICTVYCKKVWYARASRDGSWKTSSSPSAVLSGWMIGANRA